MKKDLFYISIMIFTNHHWFLCKTLPIEQPKNYIITAWWEQRSASNHNVLVYHKWIVKEISWKDVWDTMQLIRLVPYLLDDINKSNDMSDGFVRTILSILGRYTGYDEAKDKQYYYIPKLTGNRLVKAFNEIDFFCDSYDTNIIDEKKWWFAIDRDITITNKDQETYILWQFFWLCFIYWKPTISKGILSAYKIQVPILRYEIVEQLEKIVHILRGHFFVIHANYNTTQQVYEITTNDYDLLAYIRVIYGDTINVILIDKVLDLQKEIFIQYGISKQQKELRWKLYEVKR